MNINICTVKMVKEKAMRYEFNEVMCTPKAVSGMLEKVLDLSNKATENFGIVCMNTKGHIAGVHIITIGGLNMNCIELRDIFAHAITNNAKGIILFHNHPSGDVTPSKEDITITDKIVDGCKLLGIEMLDHIIVGDNNYISMREKGLVS